MKSGCDVMRIGRRIGFVLVIAGVLFIAACEEKDIVSLAEPETAQESKAVAAEQQKTVQTKAAEVKAPVKEQAKAAEPQVPATPAVAPVKAGNPVVVLKTSRGQIRIELYPARAPVTVENFLYYAKKGFYDGTIFHRVIPGFMIQGGGMTPDMREKATNPAIRNEASNGLTNDRGTIAMARKPHPDSATSQFFINVNNNISLNYAGPGREGYAVFGKVLEGMEVADAIVNVPRGDVAGHRDVPLEPILIESVTVAE